MTAFLGETGLDRVHAALGGPARVGMVAAMLMAPVPPIDDLTQLHAHPEKDYGTPKQNERNQDFGGHRTQARDTAARHTGQGEPCQGSQTSIRC